ncbi:MAG: hypothetical protein R2911_38160 [Caldilineaceae bacterium]
MATTTGATNGLASSSTNNSPTGVTVADEMALLELLNLLHEPGAEHADQADLLALVVAGEMDEAFAEAFEMGDELFETRFNALDGVGANVGNGMRFSLLRAPIWMAQASGRTTSPRASPAPMRKPATIATARLLTTAPGR